MGQCRFLFDNLITAENMLAVSSLKTGIVSSCLKEGLGSATMAATGAFSGPGDMEYIVEIDSIAAGAEVGQATFKWSDGLGSWNASRVTTSNVPVALNNGISIAHTSGTGDDFVVGDKWYFKGVNHFNAGKMIDLDRDTAYRSANLGAPNAIVINLSTLAAEDRIIQSLVLGDHNLTPGATIILMGNTADIWGAPAFAVAVPWAVDQILYYLAATQTYQYWRIEITDAANPNLYIEIAELFLGPYLEPTVNFNYGNSRDTDFLTEGEATVYGKNNPRFYNLQKTFKYNFEYLPSTDLDLLESMALTIGDKTTGKLKPIWFNENSAVPAGTWLVLLKKIPRQLDYLNYEQTTLEMTEVVKSV